MWLDRGAQHVQCIHILMVAIGVVLRNLHGLQLFQTSLLGYLVLALVSIMLQMANVCNVTHITHLVAQMLQITEQQIEGNSWTRMTQMGIAIDRRATHIHAHIRGMQWFETLHLARQCIIND